MSLDALPVPAPDPLPLPVVDSHCHLDITQDYSGLSPADAIAAARSVGVEGVIQVGVDLNTSRDSVELASQLALPGAVVGIHPNEVPDRIVAGTFEAEMRELKLLAELDPVVGIGETGLDYYRTGPEGTNAQISGFEAHIALANELDLTLVIHDRDAHDDVLAVLARVGAPKRVVFHCFSGNAEMARFVSEQGWYVSVAGVVTFKNAAELREAVAEVPLGQLLVETDAPFLTPVPNRGKPNASYLMPATVAAMADIKGTDLAEMCDVLNRNTKAAFGLGRW